ncbi:MAG TPA: efflux RND transporter periplasmic adaptor subunit [Vicinamibacterales bacterium]|nr:efflux RND transporter periplasmic adaptor subunit [Vicinamibacterales bacterium]
MTVLTAALTAACGADSSTAAAQAADATADVPLVDVAVVRATAGAIESALEVSGTLAARSRVGLQPKLPGRLERILVDIGDRVTEGQIVATIDRGEVDAQVDAAVAATGVATAGIASAEASLANAVSEHERATSLFEAGALPRQRLEAAETARRSAAAQRDLAKASLAQAEAAVRRAREVQRDTTLYAPVSGFIVERNYDPGAIPGERPVVVVADIRQLKLEAGVSEMEAGRLKTGMPALISVQARPGETFAGQIAAIVPEVDQRNRHFRIEVRVPNPDGALLAGMYASARLVLARADRAVIVPREAIVLRDGQRVVLKVHGDTLVPVAVVEGLTDGRQVQIVSGLAAGDQVLADARRQLPADARVKPVLR